MCEGACVCVCACLFGGYGGGVGRVWEVGRADVAPIPASRWPKPTPCQLPALCRPQPGASASCGKNLPGVRLEPTGVPQPPPQPTGLPQHLLTGLPRLPPQPTGLLQRLPPQPTGMLQRLPPQPTGLQQPMGTGLLPSRGLPQPTARRTATRTSTGTGRRACTSGSRGQEHGVRLRSGGARL